MRTCLVTGGAGFIGCALSAELVERFDRVVAFDILHPQVHRTPVRPSGLHRAVDLIRGDVSSADNWAALLRAVRPDLIVHLAAETGTGQSLTEASRHADVNLLGTTRMMDALVSSGHLPERIVLASSRAVYGEGEWRNRQTGGVAYPGQRTRAQLERAEWDFAGLDPVPAEAARTHPHPTSVYGSTKLGQENILRAWAQSLGVTLGTLRLQNVFGPGQSLINSYTGIVSLFAQWAREGRSIPVYEDGLIVRDFVFIADVVDALMRIATFAEVQATPYDIGSGTGTTVMALARHLARLYGAPEPHVTGQFRNGDVRHAACGIGRTEAELGWAPRVALDQGLERLAGWIDGERARRVA